MEINQGKLLAQINTPDDLKKLSPNQLTQVSEELREYIIDHVSIYGGHFGASLGVVELTVALHYVFNTPDDQLIWDVGHQAYGHKILTGRKEQFHTNRLYGGLSGFPKRSESKYDAFGVGHSSTSISAALGMAYGSASKGETERQHIAVIGDGAMTGGMAFEAMNHAGDSNKNMLIILNDNCMSIDPNVGALKDYLTDITTSHAYNKLRDDVWKVLGKISKFGPNAQEIVGKFENSLKSFLLKQSNLFESLNLRYFGPVDGHDVNHLVHVLNDLKNIPGPKILHCVTVKGKGYSLAEKDQTKWHAPGKFDKITGEIRKSVPTEPQAPKYQDVFGHTIVELAKKNEKIVGITPAMPSGSSLKFMMDQMPDRAFDVGIAEQHAVTLAAGMATQGLVPFCNIYSTFLQRAYDQVVHDVALQQLPVVFCLDRAGLVGQDGPTHHGVFDMAFLRCIPNLIIFAPMNEMELRNIMYTAQWGLDGPITIRYPRGRGVTIDWRNDVESIKIGTSRCLKEGSEIAVLTIGHIGNDVEKLIKQLDAPEKVGHYDMRFVKPLDKNALRAIFSQYKHIITVEDGTKTGGFGSAVLEFANEEGISKPIEIFGVPDKFVEHGTIPETHKLAGIDFDTIHSYIQSTLNQCE